LNPFNLHTLGGFFTGLISFTNPTLSVMLFIGFVIYEVDEDFHLRDGSYKDILEFLVGLNLVAGVWLVILGLK